ncbi:tRNA pseudouridine synthase-like 1 isoform X1 [Agelaius phoeniceus]|uniref:tRNA pseudouridine synthase-like 1 isoform X1 n=1 Tax=Agelaius phoeniceus TaxID=39638 RepID=UPI00405513C8
MPAPTIPSRSPAAHPGSHDPIPFPSSPPRSLPVPAVPFRSVPFRAVPEAAVPAGGRGGAAGGAARPGPLRARSRPWPVPLPGTWCSFSTLAPGTVGLWRPRVIRPWLESRIIWSILSAQRVSSTFHARFCALSRTYIYRLLLGCAHRSQIPVFEQDLCWAPPGGALSGLCASQPPGHPSHEGSSPAPAGHPRFQHLPLPAPRGCGPEPREDPAAAAAPAWPRPPGPAPPAQGTGVLGGEGEEQILPIPTGAEDGGRPGGRGPGQAGPGAAAGAAGAQGPPGAAPARHGPAPGALPAQRGVRAERFGPSKCPRRRGALWAEPKGIYNINYKFN